MLSGFNKYFTCFLVKPMVIIGLIFSFSNFASAQVYYNDVVGKYPLMNPLLHAAFKKPLNPNPLLSEYVRPSKYELMHWPYFPLNAAQAEARNREWERRNNRSLGEQIAGDMANDIIRNQVNSLIFGKKMPVAVRPKF